MAHLSTHRRNSAASDPNKSMDPTHKRHPKTTPFYPTTAAAHPSRRPDPTFPTSISHNSSSHSSRLNPLHRIRAFSKSSNPPPAHRLDTHLQAKAMSLSAIADPSGTLLIKPNRQHTAVVAEKQRVVAEKQRQSKRITSAAGDGKEKHKKSSLKVVKEEEKKESVEGNALKASTVSLALGGRRRSFCSSQIELADFLACNGVKVVSVDMPPFMQIHAVDCARKAHDSLEKFTPKTLAFTVKKEFDGVYGPAWHCIVGTSFGSFVTHSLGGFLYFSMDQKLHVLLFRTTVQRAD